MCVALLALFVALGGTSYAVFSLPKSSVGTKQLKNGAVTARKVRSHTLLAKDFKAGQLPAGPRGPAGPQGPNGAQGATGDQGTPGQNGSALAFALVAGDGTLDTGSSKGITAASRSTSLNDIYCFTVSATPLNAVATVSQLGGSGFATVHLNLTVGEVNGLHCPAGTNAVVQTYNTAGAATPEPFYIAFN
jgi:hypothetical protein